MRSAVRSTSWTLLLALTCLGCGPEQTAPNVILVSLDTLRADHTGLYGSPLDITPNLNRIGKDGVVFNRAIAQCTHTQDSHMSLLQSRYPTTTGPEYATLAEVLSAAGYRTSAFTGGGLVSAELGFDRGFDRYDAYPGGFTDALPVARSWLEDAPRDGRPFFMFLHSYDIHAPYQATQEYVDLFVTRPYTGPLRPEATHAYQRQLMGLDPPDPTLAEIEWNDDDRAYFHALYAAGVRETDGELGSFLASLKRSPAWDWDRDLLVVFSDHGEEFWEHGSVGHGLTLYQELLHVLLVIRLPEGAHGGMRVDSTVELMDVAPTILDVAGVASPESFVGESLMPLIRLDEPMPSDIAVSLTVKGYRSIIDYPWKLIVSRPEGVKMLFNLEEDPKERAPLGPEYTVIAAQLHQALNQTLQGELVREAIVDPDSIQNPALREQLRALGYVE